MKKDLFCVVVLLPVLLLTAACFPPGSNFFASTLSLLSHVLLQSAWIDLEKFDLNRFHVVKQENIKKNTLEGDNYLTMYVDFVRSGNSVTYRPKPKTFFLIIVQGGVSQNLCLCHT